MASPPLANERCRLLELPAELRISIYELAFTHETGDREDIDLFEATGPSKSLIMTCRQIHTEAASLYVEAYRRYWAIGKFVHHVPDWQAWDQRKSLVKALDDRNTTQIQHLTVSLSQRRLATFVYDGIGWARTRTDGSQEWFLRSPSERYEAWTFYDAALAMHSAATDRTDLSLKQDLILLFSLSR